MLLRHLVYGGREWRDMWNDEVLPYLRSLRPVAGPGVLIDRRPAGTVFRAVPAPTAAASSPSAKGDFYQSYFKLTLENGNGGFQVKIADGATGENSYAVVNGYSTYTLAPYSETVAGDRLFFLKYTPAQYNASGSQTAAATLVIASLGPAEGSSGLPSLPSGGTEGAYYMQLGRCLWNNGAPKIVQDFTGGVAEFRWYVKCNL